MSATHTIKNKIKVNFFQRKPRTGFSYSIEFIFNDVRERLADKISPQIYISTCYNDGYYTKIINILEAAIRAKGDVDHITGETHFLDFLLPKRKVILTIHDCAMVLRKTGVSKKIVQWLYLTAPVKKAKIVTATSQTTKNEIIKNTGCNPDMIRIVPVAINAVYQPNPKPFNKENPTILHIGTGYNKNLLRLIEAIKSVKCRLSIIGKLSPQQLNALTANNIDYTNEYDISLELLVEKYIECDILAFVSTAEGFGMPILEANAVERVVLTSNVSSMPEVSSNAALLVNPLDVEDIRSGIIKIINNDDLRNTLINNGRINKLRFDANRIANMYLELYKEITA